MMSSASPEGAELYQEEGGSCEGYPSKAIGETVNLRFLVFGFFQACFRPERDNLSQPMTILEYSY